MELFAFVLSHRESRFETLEVLLSPSSLSRARSWAAASDSLLESVVLSSCHRLELYGVASNPEEVANSWVDALYGISGLGPDALHGRLLLGREATRHLFEVTAGIDSILFGETSIVSQVRSSYRAASDRELCGPWLHRLFHSALRSSRLVRAVGGIRSEAGSLSSLALAAGLATHTDQPPRLLVLGSGRAGRAVLDAAGKLAVANAVLIGSDPDHTRSLAAQYRIESARFDELENRCADADLVVTASGNGRILTTAFLLRIAKARASRDPKSGPLTIVDIGMPQNTSPLPERLSTLRRIGLVDLAAIARGEQTSIVDDRLETLLDARVSHYEFWRASRLDRPTVEGARPATDSAPAGTKHALVHIVGAGPGDPELLTVKAVKLLEAADIVFFDTLIPEPVLELIPKGVRRVPVGRRLGHVVCAQEDVHRGLVSWARRGAKVVRLKGGDPMIFGRGGEEVLALQSAGIESIVVPGITAATAAAASAKIPLTERGQSASCSLITLHAADPKGTSTSASHWREVDAVARIGGTMVIYMGSTRLLELARRLLRLGRRPDHRIAVIERAQHIDERTRSFTLDEIVTNGTRINIRRPALVLVGPTVDDRLRAPVQSQVAELQGTRT